MKIVDTYYHEPNPVDSLNEATNYLALSSDETKIYAAFFGFRFFVKTNTSDDENFLSDCIDNLINKNGIDSNQVKYLIYCHTLKSIDSKNIMRLQKLKQKHELSKAVCFSSTMNNCCSLLSNLELVSNLLFDDNDYAVLLTGDLIGFTQSRVIDGAAINSSIFGGMLVSGGKQGNNLIDMNIVTDRKYTCRKRKIYARRDSYTRDYNNLVIDCVNHLLKRHSINIADISYIIPHNVNIMSWREIAKNLNFPINRVYLNNVSQYAHALNTDMIINLSDIERLELLKPNDLYLVINVGLGLVAGAALFKR